MATSLNEVNFLGFDLVRDFMENHNDSFPQLNRVCYSCSYNPEIWKSCNLLWRICMWWRMWWWHHILTDTDVDHTTPHGPFSSHHFCPGRNWYQSEIFKIFELMYDEYENSLDFHSPINIHNIHKKILSSYILQGTQKVSIWICFSYCVIHQYAFSWSVSFMYNHIQCDL